MHNKFLYRLIPLLLLAAISLDSKAQFKEEAFQQTYNEPGTGTQADTANKFTLKKYFKGMAHKDTLKIGITFASSVILPGTAQIYNKDYWKLPIVYGGIGALAGTGGYYLHKYNISKKRYDRFMTDKTLFEDTYGIEYPFYAPVIDTRSKQTGTWLMIGAGLVYWGSLLDGVVNYQSSQHPHPGRATIYSALLPGLGQIYNGELFKVPIYWGCLVGSGYFLATNNMNYKRFKRIHNEASANPSETPISAETAQWYRDVYRRYRDYSIVATVAFYLLQIIDANVFAYMHDFSVDDNITMNLEPAVIAPDNAYAIHNGPGYGSGQNAFGFKIGFTF